MSNFTESDIKKLKLFISIVLPLVSQIHTKRKLCELRCLFGDLKI